MPNWDWCALEKRTDWPESRRERAGATLGQGVAETVLLRGDFAGSGGVMEGGGNQWLLRIVVTVNVECFCQRCGWCQASSGVPVDVYLPCNENSSPATRPAALFPPARELRASFQNPSASSHSIPSHRTSHTAPPSGSAVAVVHTSPAHSLFAFVRPVPHPIHRQSALATPPANSCSYQALSARTPPVPRLRHTSQRLYTATIDACKRRDRPSRARPICCERAD